MRRASWDASTLVHLVADVAEAAAEATDADAALHRAVTAVGWRASARWSRASRWNQGEGCASGPW